MPTIKRPYWIVGVLGRKKYLIYRIYDNMDKAWNSRMFFTKDKRRATRYEGEDRADVAISNYKMYSQDKDLLLVKEEIWE